MISNHLLGLAVILLAAKISGELAQRLKLAPVFGEILAGILIGPSVFGILQHQEILDFMGSLGLILLLFYAGLDSNIKRLKASGRTSLFVALMGVIAPITLGYWVAKSFGLTDVQAVITGAALCATSVGISVRTLIDMGQFKSKEAEIVLGAAVLDDICGLLVLSVLLSYLSSASVLVALTNVAIAIGYLLLLVWIGEHILPLIMTFALRMETHESQMLIGLIIAFLAAYGAEKAGLATIVGAYIIGVIMTRSPGVDAVKERLEPIKNFVVPIFFVLIGISVQLKGIGLMLPYSFALLAAAFVGKVLGCGTISWLCGNSKLESLRIGVSMMPLGEVCFIIAAYALNTIHVFTPEIYSATVLAVIGTIIIAPLIMRVVFIPRSIILKHIGRFYEVKGNGKESSKSH